MSVKSDAMTRPMRKNRDGHRLCWYVTADECDDRVGYIVAAPSEYAAKMIVRRAHPERKMIQVCPLRFSHWWEVSRWPRRVTR